MKVTEFLEIIGEKVRNQLPVPFGVYDINTSYTCTEFVAPLVLHDGIYYILNVEGIWLGSNLAAECNNPKTDIQVNGVNAKWMAAENMKFAFVEILMANFAKLASAVFSGDHQFSQQGVDASGNATTDYSKFGTEEFTPNLQLDFNTGEVRFKKLISDGAELTNVKSMTGSFKELQCLDYSGNIVGSLKFGENGLMFDGNFSVGGDTLLNNVNTPCLGFSGTPTIVVYATTARYYTYGLGGEYTTITMSKLGTVFRLYLTDGSKSYNTVIFTSSAKGNFQFETPYLASTRYGFKVNVIHSNNAANDTEIQVYLNGSLKWIRGGGAYTFINVPPSLMNPQPSTAVYGLGWMCVSEIDNNW